MDKKELQEVLDSLREIEARLKTIRVKLEKMLKP